MVILFRCCSELLKTDNIMVAHLIIILLCIANALLRNKSLLYQWIDHSSVFKSFLFSSTHFGTILNLGVRWDSTHSIIWVLVPCSGSTRMRHTAYTFHELSAFVSGAFWNFFRKAIKSLCLDKLISFTIIEWNRDQLIDGPMNLFNSSVLFEI